MSASLTHAAGGTKAAARAESLIGLFADRVQSNPRKDAVMYKAAGRYVSMSWAALGEQVRRVAAGLVASGLQPGERVGLLAATRREWVVADLAILSAGGVTVPIYPSSVADECRYILEDSGAKLVFVEDAHQLQKLRAVRGQLPSLERAVVLSGAAPAEAWVISLANLEVAGEGTPHTLTQRVTGVSREALATIVYTSGTTGPPKGVMLSHGNLLYVAEAIAAVDVVVPEDVQLLFLPLAHTFARAAVVAWIATDHVLAFAEGTEQLRQNLQEVRPTLMAAVPRVFEKLYAGVAERALAGSRLQRQLFAHARVLSSKRGRAEWGEKRLRLRDRAVLAGFDRTVFLRLQRTLLAGLGGRMRLMVSGGAPLPRDVGWFFRDAGVPIVEGYGLTETSAASVVNRPDDTAVGTVGRALPGTQVRLAADGEVLIRGPGVMQGFWQQPEATRAVLDRDGWLHTGDVGAWSAAGRLCIKERKKDLIVTAGAKNVAPQPIEQSLQQDPLVSHAVVFGDQRPYLVALLTLTPAALKALAMQRGLGQASHAELTARPEVYAEVQARVDAVNAELPRYARIKKFAILPQEFAAETGEMTPTLKLKRRRIAERYAEVLAGMYSP